MQPHRHSGDKHARGSRVPPRFVLSKTVPQQAEDRGRCADEEKWPTQEPAAGRARGLQRERQRDDHPPRLGTLKQKQPTARHDHEQQEDAEAYQAELVQPQLMVDAGEETVPSRRGIRHRDRRIEDEDLGVRPFRRRSGRVAQRIVWRQESVVHNRESRHREYAHEEERHQQSRTLLDRLREVTTEAVQPRLIHCPSGLDPNDSISNDLGGARASQATDCGGLQFHTRGHDRVQ